MPNFRSKFSKAMNNSVVHFPFSTGRFLLALTPFGLPHRGIWQLNEQKEEEEESGTPQHFVEADMGVVRSGFKAGDGLFGLI